MNLEPIRIPTYSTQDAANATILAKVNEIVGHLKELEARIAALEALSNGTTRPVRSSDKSNNVGD